MGAPNPLKPPTLHGGNAFNPLGGTTPFGGGGHHGQPLNGLGGGGHGGMNQNPITGDGMYHPVTNNPASNPAFNGFTGLGGMPNPQQMPLAENSGGTDLATAFMHGMAPANPMNDVYLNHPRSPGLGAASMGTPQFPSGPFNAGNPQPMPPVGGMPLPGSAPPPQPMGRGPQSGTNPLMNPMFRTQ